MEQFTNQYQVIVSKLTQIRKETGMSQVAFSEFISVPRKRIINFENGKLDIEVLMKYCEKLDCEIELKLIVN